MTEQTPLVSIIIVNWNTRDLLVQCIGSVIDNTTDIAHEVIVVDNASSDGSAQAVREQFPQVKLVASEANRGFAGGNNLGIPEATGDYLLFLNPDTLVPPGAIRKMVDFLADHSEVGVVGPLLLAEDGHSQISSFGLYPSPAEAAAHSLRWWRVAPNSKLTRRFLLLPKAGETWTYTEHILGACMLFRAHVYNEIGGFDDGFFLFLEETDLCYRAQRAGWRIAYTTEASIVHLGEQSMQSILHRTGGLYIRSYNHFCRKHRVNWLSRGSANAFLVAGVFMDVAVSLAKYRSPRRAWSCMKALWYGYVVSP